jgi:hypothetical protein
MSDEAAQAHYAYQEMIFNAAQALRRHAFTMREPPAPEYGAAARAAFKALRGLLLLQDNALIEIEHIARGLPKATTRPPLPDDYTPPDALTETMDATAWAIEAIYRLLSMPNPLDEEQRRAALTAAHALADFLLLGMPTDDAPA